MNSYKKRIFLTIVVLMTLISTLSATAPVSARENEPCSPNGRSWCEFHWWAQDQIAEAMDWPSGDVTLTVYTDPEYVSTKAVDPDLYHGTAYWDLSDLNIQPGTRMELKQGNVTRTLVTQELYGINIDFETGIISGYTGPETLQPEGEYRVVSVLFGGPFLEVEGIGYGNGYWEVDHSDQLEYIHDGGYITICKPDDCFSKIRQWVGTMQMWHAPSISGLIEKIEGSPSDQIAAELKNSLVAKAVSAQKSLNMENEHVAINKLEALVNEVNAQKGKKISEVLANELIEYANNLIVLIQNGEYQE